MPTSVERNAELNKRRIKLVALKGEDETVKISYLTNLNLDGSVNRNNQKTITGKIVSIEGDELKLDNNETVIKLNLITKVEDASESSRSRASGSVHTTTGGIRRRTTRSYRRKMRSSRSRKNHRRSYRRRK